MLGNPRADIASLPLQGPVGFLDVYTLNTAAGGHRFAHSNEFTGVSYKLKDLAWTEVGFELTLDATIKDTPFRGIAIRGGRKETTAVVLRTSGRRCFLMLITPRACLQLRQLSRVPHLFVTRQPKLVRQTLPSYPQPLAETGYEARVLISGIITPDGRPEPSSLLLLECPHYWFGRSAVDTVYRDWIFEPARMEETAVAYPAQFEIKFRVKR
jgi:hypothetical protein